MHKMEEKNKEKEISRPAKKTTYEKPTIKIYEKPTLTKDGYLGDIILGTTISGWGGSPATMIGTTE